MPLNVPGKERRTLADALRVDKTQKAQHQLRIHEDTNPDEAAEDDALSDLTGLPPEAVAADREGTKRTLQQALNAQALESAPATTEMLTDPAFARQAHKDVPSLLDIEDTASQMSFGQLARQFQAEAPVRTEDLGAVGRAARRSELGLSQMGNQFMAEGAATRAADSQRSFGEIFEDAVNRSGDPSLAFTGGAAAFRYLTSRFTDPEAAQAAAAERLQNVGELSQQMQAIPRSESSTRLIQNVTAGETTMDKIMAAVTDPIGVAALSGEMMIEQAVPLATAGVAARTLGPAVGGRVARVGVGSAAFGVSSGLTERFRSPAEFFADKGIDLTDPVQAMATALDQDILDEAATFGFTRGAIIGSIDAASGGFASIAWGSAIRTALVNAVAQPMMAGAGEAGAMQATTGEVDMTDVILEAVGGGLEGMIEVPVIGGQTLFDARRSTKARQARAELQELHIKMLASALTGRSPDAAAAHVAQAMPATNVYIPVSRLDEFAEELGMEPADFYDRLDVAEQVDDARLLGGDIQLTPTQFARHVVASPETFEALADHVRGNPEDMTAAEGEEFITNGIQEILESIPEPVDIPVDTPPEVAAGVAISNRTENEALEDIPAAALEGRTAEDLAPLEDLSPEEALAEVQEGIAEAGQGADTDIRSASAAATLAQDELGLRQMFRTADEAGMTEGQYASYLVAIAKQADGVQKRQQDKVLRQRQRESSEAIKREREVVREQARETVQAQPVYQAINSIGQRRLDRKAVIDALPLGEGQIEQLPTQAKGRRIVSAKNEKDTVHPSLIADQFGFPDDQTMLFSMIDAVPEAVAIEALTDREMHLRHEDLLTEHDAIKAARESLHIDRTGQVLALEMNQLREATQQGRLAIGLIRNEARRRFGLLQVKDIQIDRFLTAQRRNAKTAGKLLRKGDRQGAADAKFHQLMNFEFARLAYKQKTKITRERKFLNKFVGEGKKFEGTDAKYIATIQELLGQFDLGPKTQERRDLQAEADKLREDDGAMIKVPDHLLLSTENWQDLMIDEWDALVQGVKNLEAQGKRVLKIRRQGELLDRKDVVAELVELADKIVDNKAAQRRMRRTDPSAFDAINHALATADASLGKMEFMLRRLDNFKTAGPWQQTFFQPIADSQTNQDDMFGEVALPILNDLKNLPPEDFQRLNKREFIEPLGEEMKRGSLLMIALHTGNESNLDKLVRGSGMRESGQAWSEQNVRDAMELLTPAEADWVQSVWDTFEEMRPQVEAIYIQEYNAPPTRVKPSRIKLGDKEFTGGYFPMMYERPDTVDLGNTAIEAMQQQHVREGVHSGMTVERTNYAAPVVTSLDRLPQALHRHIHYITHYEAVRDVGNMMKDPDIKNAVANKLGPEYLDEMSRWLKAIAVGEANRAENNIYDDVFDHLRHTTTVAVLGASYTTTLAQTLGLATSVRALGLQEGGGFSAASGSRWLANGIATYANNPIQSTKMAMELSGELRHRMDNVTQEINDGMKRLVRPKASGFISAQQRLGLRMVGAAQMFAVDVPTWLAGYNQALDQGLDVKAAARQADSILRTSQATGALKDRSRVQRVTGLRGAIVMFSTYTVLLYAMQREIGAAASQGVREASAAKVIGAVLQLGVLLLIPGFFDTLTRGEFDEDDDIEDNALLMLRNTFGFSLSSIPVLGRGLDSAMKGFDQDITPIQRVPESVLGAVVALQETITEGDDFDIDDIKKVVSAIGTTVGISGTAQANKFLDAIDESDPTVYDFFVGATRKN
jgi:hypothetical protein